MKPFYLLLFICQLLFIAVFAQTKQQRPVLLKNGTYTSLRNYLDEPGELQQRSLYKDRQHVLIQFNKLPDAATKETLAREGVLLFDYIPHNTYFATLPERSDAALLKRLNSSGIFLPDRTVKIAARLQQQLAQKNSLQHGQVIAVSFFGSLERADVTEVLKKEGAQIADTKIQPEHAVFITASPGVIEKIAALPFVSYINIQKLESKPINYYNRGTHAVNALTNLPGRNLKGKDVTVGVGDNANVETHIDFNGRLINRSPLPPASHGIHTTGTVGGGGIINPRNTGMAPKATLVSQFYSDILVNTPFYTADYNMVLTNNSYYTGEDNCPGEGEYDVLSNYIDAQLKSDPVLLHVFASGNDGSLTCSPYPASFGTVKSGFQCGKNVLTVGATMTFYDNALPAYTSRGPVNDGRLKPEIMAGGFAVTSTTLNNGYGANYGTSMAAPTVTGSLALLYERYRQLNGGAEPQAALMKAAVCNAADDYGNPGPDYSYGFGVLNARKAVETIEENRYVLNTISHGGTAGFTITGVPAGAQHLKVMLYWADPAASPNAATALVNNLDLTVTEPGGGTVHYPLILNPAPANVNDVAVEGVDNDNNIEQVVINNPPAGDFTVTVNGANIPSGPQDYVVVYEVISTSITVEYPFGFEKMVPGETEVIFWNANDGSSNTFTIEYSTDNGATWTVANNNMPDSSRSYVWTVPNLPTNNALIRVTRNGGGLSDVSDYPFTILRQPNVTASNPCAGYAQLSWPAVPSATSYDIMMLKGDSMETITSTTATSYLLGGLRQDSTYWLAVRAKANDTIGRQSIARVIVPSGGACSLAAFNNDLTPQQLLAPLTGRMYTSSQLGTEAIQVRIKNLGSVATSGSFDISYQVNGGSIVTESDASAISAAGTIDYTFTQTYDFSATGTYSIKIWVDFTSDGQHANDTLVTVIKQLENDPLVLNDTYTEGFESAAGQTYTTKALGLEGLDRCDFNTSNTNGRARTFVNTGIARSGNKAMTLDQKAYSLSPSADSLFTTFNLSGYSSADQLWLDFYYKNHGIDFSLPGNAVWIRGDENAAWIPVYTLPVNDPSHFGVYRAATPVNITETLTNAVPAQTVSSSFQVRFGQQGFTSANSVIPNGNLDDGFTYDDVTITRALNDVGVQSLISPNINSICSLSTAEPISIRVKNYSSATINNIAVSYQVNGSTVNEIIPSLTAGQELDYVFTQTANLAAYQEYILNTWVHYGPDNYRSNDSLLNIEFSTVPVISSYPYLEGFESSSGYWYTQGIGSTWDWGAPANTIINKAANGSNAWVTNLTGNHGNSELSYLYSPCFNLSGLAQPVLSFSHIFRLEDDCDCDFHWVEYSNDGITWQKLGASGSGTNWYDHVGEQVWQASQTLWHVASHDIPTTGSNVRFRFVMYSDPAVNYEGVGIDDIHVFDKAAIYTGADITSGLSQEVSGSGWIHFDSGGQRVASVNPNGQNLGATDVRVYFNGGPIRISDSQYYLDRNIVIQPSIQPSALVSVRYYFTNAEVNNLINASGCAGCTSLADAYAAGVTQYSNAPAEENGTLSDNNNGDYYFIPPNLTGVMPYDNGYYAEYQVGSFSEFWINGGGPGQNQPLPLVLGPFTVTQVDKRGLLEWSTIQEYNTEKFVIEKSYDGATYSPIGEVPAANNSNTLLQYQYTDAHLVNGINYYRLKIIDTDGMFIYSPVRMLTLAGNNLYVNVYPNPVMNGVLYINTSVECNRLELHDAAGRLVKATDTQGTQQVLRLYDVAKGVYLLSIQTGLGKRIEKVIVK